MQVVPCALLLFSVSRARSARPARSCVALAALALIATAACRSTPQTAAPGSAVTADTYAIVNGRQITRDEVEKAYRRNAPPNPASPEEASTAKLSLLNDLIVQDLLINKARELKIELPESELDTAYAEAKKNIPDDAFQAELKQRNLTPGDMRDGLRRELLTQKVMEREISQRVAVTDQDVTDFFNANRAQFNVPEESYHLAQIVITPARDAQITNGTGDDAASPQAAAAKVQMLMERLKAGASFAELARGYSEDAETAPRGGDLGLLPLSRLKQAPPQLRDAVLGKNPGAVNVAAAGGAYTLVLVVAHEQAGQRDLSTPGMKDNLTNSLKARKQQVARAAYVAAARTDADIVNYLARRLVEGKGTLPAATAPSSTPAGAGQ